MTKRQLTMRYWTSKRLTRSGSYFTYPSWVPSTAFLNDICNKVWSLAIFGFLSGEFRQLKVRWVIIAEVPCLLWWHLINLLQWLQQALGFSLSIGSTFLKCSHARDWLTCHFLDCEGFWVFIEEGVPGLSSSIRTGAGLPVGVEEVPIIPLLLLASSICHFNSNIRI